MIRHSEALRRLLDSPTVGGLGSPAADVAALRWAEKAAKVAEDLHLRHKAFCELLEQRSASAGLVLKPLAESGRDYYYSTTVLVQDTAYAGVQIVVDGVSAKMVLVVRRIGGGLTETPYDTISDGALEAAAAALNPGRL